MYNEANRIANSNFYLVQGPKNGYVQTPQHQAPVTYVEPPQVEAYTSMRPASRQERPRSPAAVKPDPSGSRAVAATSTPSTATATSATATDSIVEAQKNLAEKFDSPAATPSSALYRADGKPDLEKLRALTHKINKVLEGVGLNLGTGRKSSAIKDTLNAALAALEKVCPPDGKPVSFFKPHRGPDDSGIYEALKSASEKLGAAADLCKKYEAPPADHAAVLSSLRDTVKAMARVHNNYVTKESYDLASRKAIDQARNANAAMHIPNAEITNETSTSVSGGGGVGGKLNIAGGATAAVKAGVSSTNTETITRDWDGDCLSIGLSTKAATAGVDLNVKAAGFDLLQAKATLMASITTGELRESPDADVLVANRIFEKREGHNTTPEKLNDLGFTKVLGKTYTEQEYRDKERKQRIARSNTTTSSNALNAFGHKGQSVTSKANKLFGTQSTSYPDRKLTAAKAAKGTLQHEIPELVQPHVEKAKGLDSLYQALVEAYPEVEPQYDKSLVNKALVLDGHWVSYGGGVSLEGSVGPSFANLTTNELPVVDFSLTGKLAVNATRREVPAMLWMTPFEVIESVSQGETERRVGYMNHALKGMPQVKDYVLGNSGDLNASSEELQARMTKQLGELAGDVKDFEKAVGGMWKGRAILEAKSVGGEDETRVAIHAFQSGAKKITETFAPELTNKYQLKKTDQRPTQHALDSLEDIASVGWNAMSLRLTELNDWCQRLPKGPNKDKLDAMIASIQKRLVQPNVPMKISGLYNRGVMVLDSVLYRRQVTATSTIALNAAAGIQAVKLGGKSSLTVGLDYRDVTGHPNFVRNGKFLHLNIDSTDIGPHLVDRNLRKPIVDALVKNLMEGSNFSMALTEPEEKRAKLFDNLWVSIDLSLSNLASTTPSIQNGHTRSTEIVLQKGMGDDHYEVLYAQNRTKTSTGVSLAQNVEVYMGTGGQVGLSYSKTSSVVTPEWPVLGRNLAMHVLQNPQVSKFMSKDKQGKLVLNEAELAKPENLVHLQQSYFSTNCVLDMLRSWDDARYGTDDQTVKGQLGRLMRMPFNKKHVEALKKTDGEAQHRAMRDKARDATQNMTPAERCSYFTHGDGKPLFLEYLRSLGHISDMKTEAFFGVGGGNPGQFLRVLKNGHYMTRQEVQREPGI